MQKSFKDQLLTPTPTSAEHPLCREHYAHVPLHHIQPMHVRDRMWRGILTRSSRERDSDRSLPGRLSQPSLCLRNMELQNAEDTET